MIDYQQFVRQYFRNRWIDKYTFNSIVLSLIKDKIMVHELSNKRLVKMYVNEVKIEIEKMQVKDIESKYKTR